jgi:tetratricopeptide (TPR) repeat protein
MPARFGLALLSLWPGLAQIWTGQEVLGLILAGLFAAMLNLSVLTHLVWTEAVPPGWPAFFGAAAAGTWVATLGYTAWWLWRCHPEQHRQEIDRLYRDALELYLQGRWADARRRCEQLLARDEDDADALFQLGLIHARSGQPGPARQAFRQCLDRDAAGKWRWEVEQALQMLDGGS